MRILVRLSMNAGGEWTWSATLCAGAVPTPRQVLAASAAWQVSKNAAEACANSWLGSSAFSACPVDWEEVYPTY